MMPIVFSQMGKENTIKKIGGNSELKRHLQDLGLIVGASAVVVSSANENVILNVRDSRIAIGRDLAFRIMV